MKLDSGRQYKLTNLDELFNLSPVGNERTKSIQVTLVYLIDFPNKSAPEKQTINFYFGEYISRKGTEIIFPNYVSSGAHIKIQFTERTWAEDISELSKKLLAAISARSENNEKIKIYNFI